MSNITRTIWNSGVNRWHASRSPRLRHSGDCTDAHAARCCRLLLCLKPDASAELIAACLHHDVAEMVTGDVPWGAKHANATLRATLQWMETDAEVTLGLTTPRHADYAAWVKLVDRLDAWLWVEANDPDELQSPEWVLVRPHIIGTARALGGEALADTVAAILEKG